MKKIVLVMVCFFACSGICFAADDGLPAKAVVISQSNDVNTLSISMIDLSNSELVIAQYVRGKMSNKYKKVNVLRTGVKISTKQQLAMQGKSAPFALAENQSGAGGASGAM